MESSSISSLGEEHQKLKAIAEIRHRGWRGGIIGPHRAFLRLRLTPARVIQAMTLASLGTFGWILALPRVGRLWGHIFSFWAVRLGFNAQVTMVPQGWGSHIQFALPCFGLVAGPATGLSWYITAGITILAFASTFLLSDEVLPWTYLIRSLCLLQATALAYFALASARFPHDLPGYTISMLVFSSILIGLVPMLYAFTFYLLNFNLLQKAFLTLVTMVHLVLFVPHQYLLHIYLLHGSVLFMPVLYFVFGPFLDILAFIGFYSWGMSWKASASVDI